MSIRACTIVNDGWGCLRCRVFERYERCHKYFILTSSCRLSTGMTHWPSRSTETTPCSWRTSTTRARRRTRRTGRTWPPSTTSSSSTSPRTPLSTPSSPRRLDGSLLRITQWWCLYRWDQIENTSLSFVQNVYVVWISFIFLTPKSLLGTFRERSKPNVNSIIRIVGNASLHRGLDWFEEAGPGRKASLHVREGKGLSEDCFVNES